MNVQPTDSRFDAKVQVTDTCHLWTGAINSKGYGVVRIDGVLRLAHRVSYERHVGPIPAGLNVDHRCSVRRCVKPSDLEPVTTAENNRRSRERRKAAA